MSSRGIPGWTVLVLIVAASISAAADPQAAAHSTRDSGRPSVVLITLDTVRADHLGCYGYSRIETPNLDRLAAAGVRFTRAYTQVPITLPSHAVILTGTYPMSNGVRDFTSSGLPGDIPTLAEVLRRNGYRTAAFVSSFVLNSMWGLNRGFEVYDDDMGPGVGHSEQLALVQRRGDRTVDRMFDWLNRNGREPFFAWIHLYDAHSPYSSPDPYRTRYRSRPYDGAIAFDDAQVGRVITRLRQMALYDNTLIVLTSDHGESLGEHGEAEHGFFIYNATIHVPLVLKLPRQPVEGRVVLEPVSTVDIASTVAQVCRIPAAQTVSFEGRSLDLLASSIPPVSSPDAAVYAESYYPRDSFGWHELRGVVTAEYEYIGAPRPELYGLDQDPGERSNIMAGHRAVASSLRQSLARFAQQFRGREERASGKAADPETLEKLRSLGYVAYRGAGAGNKADPKDKISTLNRILRAGDLTQLGRYAEAGQILDELAQEEPALYVVHFEKGENDLAWGRPHPAVEEFRKTLSINPTFDQAALGLGRAYFLLGQDHEAATSFELALQLNGRNFLARLALAKVYWRQKLLDEARSELAKVVGSHPQFAEGHADYGIILAELRSYKEALAELQRGIDLGFRDAMVYNYLGIAYENVGDPTQAMQAYQTAVEIKPDYAAAYLNMALEYRKQGQQSEARIYYLKTCKYSSQLCRQYESAFSSPTQD